MCVCVYTYRYVHITHARIKDYPALLLCLAKSPDTYFSTAKVSELATAGTEAGGGGGGGGGGEDVAASLGGGGGGGGGGGAGMLSSISHV